MTPPPERPAPFAPVPPAPPADASAADDALFDLELKVLLEAIYMRWQHDFRHYAPSSLRRRLRQALVAMGHASLAELQGRVMRDAQAFSRLLQYLTVQVSEMFRDPPYFLALRAEVLPELATYPSLKVWVAGCSQGEELWSLAILLHEEGLLDRTILYATDINPQALAAAQAGVYPRDRAAAFSRQYLAAGGKGSLADHYTCDYDRIVLDRRLKRQVVFADHSLATDAVFSEVHLVSCRNVLIYFDQPLQDRAIGLFRDALVRRGFLGLGSRETLRFGTHAPAFDPWPPGQPEVRLYRKR